MEIQHETTIQEWAEDSGELLKRNDLTRRFSGVR